MKRIDRFALLLAMALLLGVTSCKKEPPVVDEPDPVEGCTDPNAMNYDADAEVSDGSCEYADVFVPMRAGNSWHLEDDVFLVFTNALVTVDFVQQGDTLVGETTYMKQRETINVDGFGTMQDGLYGYRQVNTGQVYRIDLTDTAATEKLFMDYPLELGHTWKDDEANPATESMVVSTSLLSVPAGNFTNVVGIQATELQSGQPSTLYFAKDVGLARVDIDMEFQTYQINIQAELTAYTLP